MTFGWVLIRVLSSDVIRVLFFLFTDAEYYECDIKCFTVAVPDTPLLECNASFEIFIIWANIGWDSTFQCNRTQGYMCIYLNCHLRGCKDIKSYGLLLQIVAEEKTFTIINALGLALL